MGRVAERGREGLRGEEISGEPSRERSAGSQTLPGAGGLLRLRSAAQQTACLPSLRQTAEKTWQLFLAWRGARAKGCGCPRSLATPAPDLSITKPNTPPPPPCPLLQAGNPLSLGRPLVLRQLSNRNAGEPFTFWARTPCQLGLSLMGYLHPGRSGSSFCIPSPGLFPSEVLEEIFLAHVGGLELGWCDGVMVSCGVCELLQQL